MSADSKLRLLACQINIPPMTSASQRDEHLEKLAQKINEALADDPVDLIVLPELSSIDYSRDALNNIKALAEPLDGPSYQCWRSVARRYSCYVSYGFARRDGDKTYISVAVVDREGELVGYYDKIHLAQYGASIEKEFFDRGNHLFTFSVNGLKLAPIICYDIRIPELSRSLAIEYGVDLILHCGAYYRDESFHSWHAFAMTRALENQVFFLSLNRAGANYGHSVFCRPWMDESIPLQCFSIHDEDFCMIEIKQTEIKTARNRYTFLKDRLKSYNL